MNREIDKLGRIVLPKEMRDAIGLENEAEAHIELHDDKIIVTNPKGMRNKETILAMKHSMENATENKNNEIEKIPYHYNLGYIDCGDLKREVVEELSNNFNYFADKINELIDETNKLKDVIHNKD